MAYLVIIIAIFAVMWLFMIRPQRRRQVERQRMISEVAEGDEVLLAGGVFGYVQSVGEDELGVEIAPGVTVRVARHAIAALVPPEEEDEIELGEDAAEELDELAD